MGETDIFGEYVRTRLDAWGHEFALHRDCEYLGHHSKNMLQVLIEHRGEMPGRVQGYKPLEVDPEALQIERIVADIARDQPRIACCLRAAYCGRGRVKCERYETALLLVSHAEPGAKLPTMRQYLAIVETGRTLVRGALIGIAQAA